MCKPSRQIFVSYGETCGTSECVLETSGIDVMQYATSRSRRDAVRYIALKTSGLGTFGHAWLSALERTGVP
jgi:hypothetical protein